MRETIETFWDWVMTTTVRDYKIAIVKFNNAFGALLCNGCRKIIKQGFEHEDKHHFCKECTDSMENYL